MLDINALLYSLFFIFAHLYCNRHIICFIIYFLLLLLKGESLYMSLPCTVKTFLINHYKLICRIFTTSINIIIPIIIIPYSDIFYWSTLKVISSYNLVSGITIRTKSKVLSPKKKKKLKKKKNSNFNFYVFSHINVSFYSLFIKLNDQLFLG